MDILYTPRASQNEFDEKWAEEARKRWANPERARAAKARREKDDREEQERISSSVRMLRAAAISREAFHQEWLKHMELLRSQGRLPESATSEAPPPPSSSSAE